MLPKLLKTVIQQHRMVLPVIGVIHGHRNQSSLTALGTADQNPASSFRITGFDPDSVFILPQKLIVIGKGPILQGYSPGGDHLPKDFIFHGMCRQHRQIPGRAVMLFRIQTMGIGKHRVPQVQFLCSLIHLLHKGCLTAAAMDRQRHCSVVTRVKHQTVQEHLYRMAVAFLQMQRRPFHPHSLRRNKNNVCQIALLRNQ